MSERVQASDSPALNYRSPHYPRMGFEGTEHRVPKRVMVIKDVRGDLPFGPRLFCASGDEFDCWVNSHGAVSAITSNGLLGLKPGGEFTVLEYHESVHEDNP